MKRFIPLILLAFAGCAQIQPEDTELRTVPVTNNPHIVPQGSGFPGAPMNTSRM